MMSVSKVHKYISLQLTITKVSLMPVAIVSKSISSYARKEMIGLSAECDI